MKKIQIIVSQADIKIKYDFIKIQCFSIGEMLYSLNIDKSCDLTSDTMKGLVEYLNRIGVDVQLQINDKRPFYERDYIDIDSGEYLAK